VADCADGAPGGEARFGPGLGAWGTGTHMMSDLHKETDDHADRRRAQRYVVNLPTDVLIKGARVTCRLVDISERWRAHRDHAARWPWATRFRSICPRSGPTIATVVRVSPSHIAMAFPGRDHHFQHRSLKLASWPVNRKDRRWLSPVWLSRPSVFQTPRRLSNSLSAWVRGSSRCRRPGPRSTTVGLALAAIALRHQDRRGRPSCKALDVRGQDAGAALRDVAGSS
jgi:hypothetical protein